MTGDIRLEMKLGGSHKACRDATQEQTLSSSSQRTKCPPDRWKDVAYARIVCNVRPQKEEEVNRARLTFGGNNLTVPMDYGTPTADLLTVKLLLNSVISTPGAKFMTLDLKHFYLNTPMERPEFLRMKIDHFPQDVIDHYTAWKTRSMIKVFY